MRERGREKEDEKEESRERESERAEQLTERKVPLGPPLLPYFRQGDAIGPAKREQRPRDLSRDSDQGARDLKAQDTSGKAKTDMAGHTDLSSPLGYSPAFRTIPWACARPRGFKQR